jgi:chromosome segregation ATPase
MLWLVTVLALVAAAIFHTSNKSKSEELAKLHPQLQELESLRAQNAELKANQLSAEEMDRMRKNTEELIRLRNEVRQLRETEKQLTQQTQKAQAEIQRAQEQAAAARTQAQTAQTAQAQALAQFQAALTSATNVAQALTPEQQAAQQASQRAFQERYGLAPGGAQTLPAGQPARACINNLRQLDGAKQQWALENRKTAEATPTVQEVSVYFKDGAFPRCPSGGVYTLNSMQTHPTCSAQGHALSQ